MTSLSNIQAIRVARGTSPEALTEILRNVTVPIEVLSFGQDSEGHFAYYNTHKGMEAKVINQLEQARRGISRGGEALS